MIVFVLDCFVFNFILLVNDFLGKDYVLIYLFNIFFGIFVMDWDRFKFWGYFVKKLS